MRASRQAVTANYRTTRDMTRPQIIRKDIMLGLLLKLSAGLHVRNVTNLLDGSTPACYRKAGWGRGGGYTLTTQSVLTIQGIYVTSRNVVEH